jgi:hypothetical protein
MLMTDALKNSHLTSAVISTIAVSGRGRASRALGPLQRAVRRSVADTEPLRISVPAIAFDSMTVRIHAVWLKHAVG